MNPNRTPTQADLRARFRLGQDSYGYIYKRIGRYNILEGAGPDGGSWFAHGNGEYRRFNNKEDAIQHAYMEQPSLEEGEDCMDLSPFKPEAKDGMAHEHSTVAKHYQNLISQYPDATERPEWERRLGVEQRKAAASSAAGMDAPSLTNGPRQLVDRSKNGKPIYYSPRTRNYETTGTDGETYVFRSLDEAKSFHDERGGSAAIKDAQDPTLSTAQEDPMTIALREGHGIIAEAAKKAGMSVEDYLAQRKRAHPGHLRTLQRKEMEI